MRTPGVPAEGSGPWPAAREKRARLLLEFVRAHGAVHPREVDSHFSHGTVKNYWGGSSNATTHLLAAMHYRGMLRVARRERGVRIYAAHRHGAEPADSAERLARIDALVDVAVRIYAPLPGHCLSDLLRRLRFAVPAVEKRIEECIAGVRPKAIACPGWWCCRLVLASQEDVARFEAPGTVRLLTPFDPVVWDRDRFELLWSWVYRFEAYTPAPKRKLGYYAMPLLWRDRVVGWANLFRGEGET